MCGIVGYVGSRKAQEFLLEGLRRLEYRGYDSAGTATINGDGFLVTKTAGRITRLAKQLATIECHASVGIGHTRWATHGAATETNAHPHVGGDSALVVAHNGVIENFAALRAHLQNKGYAFNSETDTEVIAHLIADCLRALVESNGQWQGTTRGGVSAEDFSAENNSAENNGDARAAMADFESELGVQAIRQAMSQLRGTFGLAIIFRRWPDMVFACRVGSPLVVGVGNGEHFLASDASPLVGYTDKIVYLADNQIAMLRPDSLEVFHRDSGAVPHDIHTLALDVRQVELDGFDHFMLKEIFEQPTSLENTMRGRLSNDDATAVFGGLNLTPQQLRQVRRVVLTGCGTSWHSALVGEYLIEEIAQLPVEVEYASELRYRNAPMDDRTLVFAITQSGETADTLAALREMKRKGHLTMAICNVVGSSIAQEADGGIYLHAGPEIGVASTKAYTSQCLALAMLALYLGRLRHVSYDLGRKMIDQMRELPDLIRQTLQTDEFIKQVAAKYQDANNFLYLGRHYNFPTALEGALKLKEISYIHAQGYPAAEMKHGPIALVDQHTPSVFVMPQGYVYDKVMSNLQEIKARGGPVIAIAANGDDRVMEVADDVIFVPHVEDFLQPIVTIVPLQLLAYHVAINRGCDVDKPRNLAKSVTVE